MLSWLIVGVSGVIHISTANLENKTLSNAFRPIPLIALLTILTLSGSNAPHVLWVAIGLLFSIISSAILLTPHPSEKIRFFALLIAFCAYSRGFWLQATGDIAWWLPALLLASSIIIFLLLLPKLDRVLFSGSLMALVLVQMNWAAWQAYLTNSTIPVLLASLGCFLFILKILLRSVGAYKSSLPKSSPWIVCLSYIAHSLIVASVVYY